MAVVIVHPEFGVYLGSSMGLGFWTLIDTVGQVEAVVFPEEEDAREHIAGWPEHNDSNAYRYVEVDAPEGYASIEILKAAGLSDVLGDMEENV